MLSKEGTNCSWKGWRGIEVREGGHVAEMGSQVGKTNEMALIEGQRWETEEAGDDTAHRWPQGSGLTGREERPC